MKILNNNYSLPKCDIDEDDVDIVVENNRHKYILRSFNEKEVTVHLFVEDKEDLSMLLISFEIKEESFNSILGYIKSGGREEIMSVINSFLDMSKESSSLTTKLEYVEELENE